METTTPAGQPIVSREKTAPFLIRTFIKIGSFHRLTLFEDGTLPTTDEQQIFTWKDATLREVLTTLRTLSTTSKPEFRHPLARYSFRAIYADAASRGRFAQKDLGMVYSRDILGEPGTLHSVAPRLADPDPTPDSDVISPDNEGAPGDAKEKEERTLEELRFVPGDYMCVAVLLPKNVTLGGPAPGSTEISIKGTAHVPSAGAEGTGRGWGAPAGRGGGHWRGDSNPPPAGPAGRGRGGRTVDRMRDRDNDRELDRDRERDRDRRVPPPRRDSPPHRGGRGRGWGRSRSRERSRTRSPPPPPRRRYD